MDREQVRLAMSSLCNIVPDIEDPDDRYHIYITIGMLAEFLTDVR